MKLPRRAWPLAAAVLAATFVVSFGGQPAEARDESCAGVWVVIDPGPLGGSATLRCAPGDPTSGIAALRAAGHTAAYLPSVPGFVCTIDARPDPCNGAPPQAYWSYWWAPAGGSWNYAVVGAGQRDPAPGDVEGWVFGEGSTPPAVTPPAASPAEPVPIEPSPDYGSDPEPDPEEPTGAAPDEPDPGAAPPVTEPDGGVEQTTAEPDEGPADQRATTAGEADRGNPSTAPGADARTRPSDATDPRERTDDADAPPSVTTAAAEQPPGTPAGLIVGLGLVLLIAGATWLRARQAGA